MKMAPEDAAERTVIVIGHPSNGLLARKHGGRWLTLMANGAELTEDQIRGARIVAGPDWLRED